MVTSAHGKRFGRTRLVAAAAVAVQGCALVAGLGDPKQLAGTPTMQAAAIAVGARHACAAVEVAAGSPQNGSVLCWGDNDQGQLGRDPGVVSSTSEPLAVAGFPAGFTGASALALSDGASCALSPDGFLFCWGSVPSEVAAGVHRASATPVQQPSVMQLDAKDLQPVDAVAMSESGGCALEQGTLVCWGSLAFYSGRDAGVPGGASVSDPGFSAVAAGAANACALAQSAEGEQAVCWGDDTYGQSGGGAGGSLADPAPVALAGNVLQVAAGADFACALQDDGSVWCWGNDDRGQLGDPGAPAAASAAPVQVRLGGLKASSIALGAAHACAVVNDAAQTFQNVVCWGDNTAGQLGAGAGGPAQSAAPLEVQRAAAGGGVDALPHVLRIAAGGSTTCVVRSTDTQVWCWGKNDAGQAGQPAATSVVALASPVAW